MNLDRRKLYRFPWSKTDNPGAWVEVTDDCDLTCEGCYRHRLQGHRPLEAVKDDILAGQRLTRCDSMAIAGGEPLIYPHIVEVVDFIAKRGLKPVILTNGEKLTPDLALTLKKAGLAKVHFHVDSGQERSAWKDKNEKDINRLRQHYADLLWELDKVQCGFNVTVYRRTLQYLPDIVE
jgi:MoaA/NifB/PqqE/SkfB family radical SAM enzyme